MRAVKSLLDRIRDRCRVDEASGCWHWRQGRGAMGYPIIGINALARHPLYVHRLVYVIAVGPLSSKRIVVRTCGEQDCVAPEHLVALTPTQAAALEQRRTGRPRGAVLAIAHLREAGPKLNRTQVRDIRARLQSGATTQAALAREFGVNKSLISEIWRNRAWREATPFTGITP